MYSMDYLVIGWPQAVVTCVVIFLPQFFGYLSNLRIEKKVDHSTKIINSGKEIELEWALMLSKRILVLDPSEETRMLVAVAEKRLSDHKKEDALVKRIQEI